jgi:hypothetical protein
MATTNHMIQLLTEQIFDVQVTDVPALVDEAYLLLDPRKNTVIREIAVEQTGGIVASQATGVVPLGDYGSPFAEVKLVYLKRERADYFYAPSHVPSPASTDAGLAVLKIVVAGGDITSPGKLACSRAIGAHAYIDQTD